MHDDKSPDEKTQGPTPPPKIPSTNPEKEIGGRDGPEPVRYGDWEKGGIAVDF